MTGLFILINTYYLGTNADAMHAITEYTVISLNSKPYGQHLG